MSVYGKLKKSLPCRGSWIDVNIDDDNVDDNVTWKVRLATTNSLKYTPFNIRGIFKNLLNYDDMFK